MASDDIVEKREEEQRQAVEMLCTDMIVPKGHLLRKIDKTAFATLSTRWVADTIRGVLISGRFRLVTI
jgi:hypothetical protein